jgi:hypothetical protein
MTAPPPHAATSNPPPSPFRAADEERTVRAYHGTSTESAHKIIQEQRFKISINPYDWMGKGIYFWPDNRTRAWEWANKLFPRGAAVLVVTVRLGRCLDLTTSDFHSHLQLAYLGLKEECATTGKPLPENKKLRFDLECVVINRAVEQYLPDTQSVLAHFREGDPLYEGSSFHTQDHFQLCVRDPGCIVSKIQLDRR